MIAAAAAAALVPASAAAQQNQVLTGEFVGVPEVHDGSEFSFELSFSAEPKISYRVFSTSELDIAGGALSAVSRVVRGSNGRWSLTVAPDSGHRGDIVIELAATQSCDDANAICTSGEEPLAEAVTVTVAGPGEEAPSETDGG